MCSKIIIRVLCVVNAQSQLGSSFNFYNEISFSDSVSRLDIHGLHLAHHPGYQLGLHLHAGYHRHYGFFRHSIARFNLLKLLGVNIKRKCLVCGSP